MMITVIMLLINKYQINNFDKVVCNIYDNMIKSAILLKLHYVLGSESLQEEVTFF